MNALFRTCPIRTSLVLPNGSFPPSVAWWRNFIAGGPHPQPVPVRETEDQRPETETDYGVATPRVATIISSTPCTAGSSAGRDTAHAIARATAIVRAFGRGEG